MTTPPIRTWLPLKNLSLFDIISQCTLQDPEINKRPFHHLCTLMRKMGAQSLWIDEFNSKFDSEIAYEFNHLKSFVTDLSEINSYKLYFVKEQVTDRNKNDLSRLTFLSYSSIINYVSATTSNSYLLFSLVTVPKKYNLYDNKAVPLTNYYFHTIRDYQFTFRSFDGNNVNVEITGAPFFQKNDVTTFCIQTALATLLNQAENRDSLILPVHINEIAGLSKAQCLQGGMDIKNTKQVIKKSGFFTQEFNFHVEDTDKLFNNLKKKYDLNPSGIIYPWMESGFPGFIVFETKKGDLHAVPIIGHTLNTDKWDPEADIRYRRNVRNHFRSVSAWVDNYIIHDDNFGMYLCYPPDKLEEKKRKFGYLVHHVLFMTKSKAIRSPDRIEIDLIDLIRNILKEVVGLTENNPWLYKLKHDLNAPLVSRTIAVTSEKYFKHLKTPDSYNKVIHYRLRKKICEQLPDKFWLTEITIPDLYVANKTVLINYVSDLKTGDLLFIRLPKYCFIFSDEDELEIIELKTLGHFKLFSLERDHETFDW